MFNRFTVSAVVAAILITAGSAAMAAPKHAVRHQVKIPANAYLSFAAVRPAHSSNVPGYMKIQDIGFNESLGD